MAVEKVGQENEIRDGGPAFSNTPPLADQGMSLRDWFAGLAMQGILISVGVDRVNPVIGFRCVHGSRHYASRAGQGELMPRRAGAGGR